MLQEVPDLVGIKFPARDPVHANHDRELELENPNAADITEPSRRDLPPGLEDRVPYDQRPAFTPLADDHDEDDAMDAGGSAWPLADTDIGGADDAAAVNRDAVLFSPKHDAFIELSDEQLWPVVRPRRRFLRGRLWLAVRRLLRR